MATRVDRPRTTLRQLAALATVVRAIVEDIAARGGPVIDAHYRALERVEARVRGDGALLTKAEVAALTAEIMAHSQRFGVGSPPGPKAVFWISGPLVRLVTMARTGADDSRELLNQASYALGSLHEILWAEYAPRLEAMHKAALATHAALSDEPLPAKPARGDGGAARARRGGQA